MIILHNFHHVWISVTRYVYPILYIYITYMSNCVFYIFFIHLIIIYYIYTYLHYDLSISVNPLNCICIYLLLYVATLYYIYISHCMQD